MFPDKATCTLVYLFDKGTQCQHNCLWLSKSSLKFYGRYDVYFVDHGAFLRSYVTFNLKKTRIIPVGLQFVVIIN